MGILNIVLSHDQNRFIQRNNLIIAFNLFCFLSLRVVSNLRLNKDKQLQNSHETISLLNCIFIDLFVLECKYHLNVHVSYLSRCFFVRFLHLNKIFLLLERQRYGSITSDLGLKQIFRSLLKCEPEGHVLQLLSFKCLWNSSLDLLLKEQ